MRGWRTTIAIIVGSLAPLVAVSEPVDLLSCTTAADCVVSCEDDCCPNCGCHNVMNRRAAEHFRDTRASRCTPEIRRACPDLACRLDMTLHVPVCESGRCRLAGDSRRPFVTSPTPTVTPVAPTVPTERPAPVRPPVYPPVPSATPVRAVLATPLTYAMPGWKPPKPDFTGIPVDQRCTSDADCTLSCEGCCGAPCGCNNAVTHAAAKREASTKEARCRRFDARKCPTVACAYETWSATCRQNRCRAEKGFGLGGGSSDAIDPRLPSGTTTLEGVRIEFPVQPTTFTRSQLRRGVVLKWNLVVDPGPGGPLAPDLVPNNCGRPGGTGLVTHAIIEGRGQRYCLCDTGLCAPRATTTTLAPGRDAGSLRWDGTTWEGPSDTGMKKGPPFKPGPAVLKVTSTGTYQGRRFTVHARLPLTVR